VLIVVIATDSYNGAALEQKWLEYALDIAHRFVQFLHPLPLTEEVARNDYRMNVVLLQVARDLLQSLHKMGTARDALQPLV
jgi:hypothetical protein